MFLCVMLIFTAACKRSKETAYTSSGTLQGFDLGLCPCCGGVILKGDDNQSYRIESLPGMSGQDFGNLSFPKRIRYNSQLSRVCGSITYITITSYKFE